MRSRLILRSVAAAVSLAAGALLVSGQDAAYVDDQIREGRQAWEARQYVEAAEHFRLAGFAAIEAPVRFTEALARLALAQEAAGAHADADATIARFLEVEGRNSRYAEAPLELSFRVLFERLLRSRVPGDRLAAVPSLAGVARGVPPSEPLPAGVPPSTPPVPVAGAAVPPPPEQPESPAPTETPLPTSAPATAATSSPRPPAPTRTPSSTPTPTETPIPPPTRTLRPPTATRTVSPTATDTPTPTETPSATVTPTVRPPTATRTRTSTPTSSPTRTPRPPTPTRTPTRVPPTALPTRTPVPPTPKPPATPRTLPLEAVDQPPRVTRIVQPVYPPEALRRRVRGLVVLRVLISETGVPLQPEVVQGAAGGLTEAAVAAVTQWRFEPAMAGGSPVRTHTTIRIPFEGVQFATPTPGEESGAQAPAARESPAAEAPATPTPIPPRPPPAASPVPAPSGPARAALETPVFPVPPEPPSGERGPEGPVFRTRRAIRIALTPEQARVWIDGRFVGIASDWDRRRGGPEFVFEKPGPHAFHAELPGHSPFEAEIDVASTADAESAAIVGSLTRSARLPFARLSRPAASTRGRIVLAVDRADAELSIDGVSAGPAAAFTEEEPLSLAGPAAHELKVTSPGGGVRTLRVVVSPSAPAEVPTLRIRLGGAAPGRESLAGARRE